MRPGADHAAIHRESGGQQGSSRRLKVDMQSPAIRKPASQPKDGELWHPATTALVVIGLALARLMRAADALIAKNSHHCARECHENCEKINAGAC